MSIRSFIRLNFKEDCFSITKRIKFNNFTWNWFYFLTPKEAVEAELDSTFGGCERRGGAVVCGTIEGDISSLSDYPQKVLILFSECVHQSKIYLDYPRSVILKILEEGE